ncbi:MAG: DUF2339 domain-containing protein [Candidatus Zambryskibacteria bacterium]|nr:DUF2339 domain-containing protein [Candidatus Zambryskibacteria bacterium]
MIELIVICLGVGVLIRISSLSSAVREIKAEVAELKNQKLGGQVFVKNTQTSPGTFMPPTPSEMTESQMIVDSVVQGTPYSSPTLGSVASDDISHWFKENILLKIGILMVLAGFGWFVSYAFIQNWIGPVGRISLGFITGALITIFGTFRLGKNEVQGNAFTILGSALIIITALAGQYYYDFFTPFMVLGIAFLVSVYVSMTAVAYQSEKLGVYGLLISLSAPFFSHTTSIDPFILYAYLFVVSAASIGLSVIKGWRLINVVGISGVLLYSTSIIFGGLSLVGDSRYMILALIYAISLLYLCVSSWSLIQKREQATYEDVYLTIANTALVLGTTIQIVPETYQGLIIAGWMLVYAFSGFFVFQQTKNEKLFYIHALVSILLLAVATSIELSGQTTLVIAFAIEAAVIIVASYVVTNKISIARGFGLLLIAPGLMSLPSLVSSKWDQGVLHSDFAVLLILALVSVAVGYLYSFFKEQNSKELQLHQFMFIVGTFYVYAIIWLSAHALAANDDSAVFVSLLTFTLIGLTTHFIGLFKDNSVLKNYGKFLLILVVGRLLLVDVWKMELALRVVTFIVLGIMFMSTAFIGKKKETSVISPMQ